MLNLALLGAKISQREQLLRQASLWLAPVRTGSLVSLASRTMPITFSRSTTTTFLDKDGFLKTAGINVPVIEYDANGNRLGLRVWEAVTNLSLQSQAFDNASWSKLAASATANTATAPDNTVTADSLIESATTNIHVAYQDIVGSASTQYTQSIFAKANTRSHVQLSIGDGGPNSVSAVFDLSAGTIVTTTIGGTGSGVNASIKSYPNGWYRISVTGTPATTGTIVRSHIYLISSTLQGFYAGDGVSGIYIWGNQLQAGTLGPYAPTTTAAASSTADVMTITGEDLSRIINQTEGTIYIEYGPHDATTPASNNSLFTITDSTISTANIIESFAGSNIAPVLRIESNGVNQAYITSLSYDPSVIHKLAAAYKVNDFARSLDTQPIGTDISGALPAVAPSILEIGSRNFGGVKPLNGYIRELAIFRKVLPSRSLVLLTQ